MRAQRNTEHDLRSFRPGYFAPLFQSKEYYIWSALNDSNNRGEMTGYREHDGVFLRQKCSMAQI